MVLALAKWRYSLVIIMRLGYVIIYVIRLFFDTALSAQKRRQNLQNVQGSFL